jgi:tetratricopeptide (TPR) repeat protein
LVVSEPGTRAAVDSPPIPLGEPPVDPVKLLGCPADPPTTVDQCNEESLQMAQLLLESLSDFPEGHAQMAFAYLQLGKDELALEQWREAAKLDENFATAYLGMAGILKEAAENEEAIRVLRRALEVDPQLEHAYRELVEVLLRENRAEEAKPVAEELVRRFPNTRENPFWLGQVHMQLKEYAEARQAHEKAVGIDPEFSLPYNALSIACLRLGDRENATRYRKRFAEVKAEELQRDRHRNKVFDDLLAQKQALVRRHVMAGSLQLQHGDARLAEAHWVRAAQVNPRDTATRQALVKLYEQQRRVGAELKYLTELMKMEPENPTYCVRKAHLLIGRKEWDEAEQLLTRVLQEQDADSAEAHLLLADLYLRSGRDLAAAEEHADRATQVEASSDGLLLLAAIRGERGDVPGALVSLRQALRLDPSNVEARRTYEQLRKMQ